jgi:hypothetical protein
VEVPPLPDPRATSRCTSAAALVGVLLLGALGTLSAQPQREVRLEAGRAIVGQRSTDSTDGRVNASLFAVHWRQPRENLTFLGGANLTYSRDSIAAAQAVAAISVPWSASERNRTEAGIAGATFSLRSAGKGGNVNIFGRHHIVDRNRGAWAGIGLAGTKRDGSRSNSSILDIGGWQRVGPVFFGLSVAHLRSTDFRLMEDAGVITDNFDIRSDVIDAQANITARNGPHEFTLTFTNRRGVIESHASANAMSANGVLQLTDRLGLVAAGGRQLADPLRGLPQADIFAISARFALGPKPLPVMQRSPLAHAEVIPVIGGGGELSVRVFASDTMIVDIAGDFSSWEPIPLVREGAFFVARVELPPGKYRVAIRVNLGVWRAPRNLARVRDDYGGEAGLVVIP